MESIGESVEMFHKMDEIKNVKIAAYKADWHPVRFFVSEVEVEMLFEVAEHEIEKGFLSIGPDPLTMKHPGWHQTDFSGINLEGLCGKFECGYTRELQK